MRTDGLIRSEGVGPREQRPSRLPPRTRRSQLAGSDRTQTAASIQRATAVRGLGDQIHGPLCYGAKNNPPSSCLHETIDDHGWVGSKHPMDPPAAQDRAPRCPHISGTPQCWGTQRPRCHRRGTDPRLLSGSYECRASSVNVGLSASVPQWPCGKSSTKVHRLACAGWAASRWTSW